MEIEDLIRELQTLQWAGTQDAMGALILQRGWTRDGGATYKDGERRTYKAAWGWTWSVMSKAGSVFWQSIELLRLDSQDEKERERAAREYETILPRIASILGPPEHNGTVLDDPKESPLPANRIARWRVGEAYLTLCEGDPPEPIFPASVSLDIQPAATYDQASERT